MRFVLVCLLAGCGGVTIVPDEDPPDLLSETGLLTYADGAFEYARDVVPYDLNTPLFSDHTSKDRALWLPRGETATWSDDEVFDFPVGTVLIKSFSMPADLAAVEDDLALIETRLLIHADGGWEAWPYLWNDARSEATLVTAGTTVPTTLIDEGGEALSFSYLVPSQEQCAACHTGRDDDGEAVITPIGTKARHLARDHDYDGVSVDQLDHLEAEGLLDSAGDVAPAYDLRRLDGVDLSAVDASEIEFAARSWLDVNCAHCHNPEGGAGVATQLFLDHDNTDPATLGVCKVAAMAWPGLTWDIVPGNPQASILYQRMTVTTGALMPPIGRATSYTLASGAVARWIGDMEGTCAVGNSP